MRCPAHNEELRPGELCRACVELVLAILEGELVVKGLGQPTSDAGQTFPEIHVRESGLRSVDRAGRLEPS
jgi:hypothetical protein